MKFLIREPDAGNLHVRFDERDVETNPSKDYASRLDPLSRRNSQFVAIRTELFSAV